MATGVPKGRRSKWDAAHTHSSRTRVTLEYSGKKTASEIIAMPAATLQSVVSPKNYGGEGQLYFGENMSVLLSLVKDSNVKGRVKLIYIDPPFATQTAFHSRSLTHAYEDTVAGSEFIESLRQRLIVLHKLLAADGSLYLHLDEKMVFHMKIVLDEIFGPDNYRNCIVRKKCNPKNYTRKQFGNISDYILFYSKSDSYIWNRPIEKWTEERAKEYVYLDSKTGRRFMKVPIHAPGVRHGETGKPWRGMMPPPGKHWQYTPTKLDEFDTRGEIFWSSNGNPRRKVFLDENKGVGVQDIWLDYRDAHNQNICITGYPTEKNPALLERIIQASSNPGDLVLDAFAGSGTTLEAASKQRRRWIGIDNSREAIETMLGRFANGLERMGDFVSERNGKSDSELLQSQLSFEETAETLNGDGLHAPITDYEILTTAECHQEALDIVKLWQEKLKKAA
jgi:adenine-specific DNA-methyltransferase